MMPTSSLNSATYMFKIDSRGDISAHLEDYIQGFKAYSAAICLNVADEGMLPFYLHLSDAELLLRHPGAIRTPAIQKPVRPLDTDPHIQIIHYTSTCLRVVITITVILTYIAGSTSMCSMWYDIYRTRPLVRAAIVATCSC